MTLILFVPHKNGYLLVSDRQDTHFSSNEKFDFQKIYFNTPNGPAIGFSGSTDLIRIVCSHLGAVDLTDENTVFKNIQDQIDKDKKNLELEAGKFATVALNPGELKLEMLVLYKFERVKLAKLTNFNCEPLTDLRRIHAAPDLNPEAKRYLEISTSDLDEREAIEIGREILQQTSLGNFTIGPPEYHGFDVISVSMEGVFTYKHMKRKIEFKSPTEVLRSVKREKSVIGRFLSWIR